MRSLLAVAAFAFALRVAVLVVHPPVAMGPDGREYWALAGDLAEHGVLGPEGRPSALRLPGYPVFLLGLRGLGVQGVLVVQALLDAVTVVLVGLLAGALVPGSRAPVSAGVAWALYPYGIRYALTIGTEALAVPLLVLALLLVVRLWGRRSLAWAGVVLAALFYVRPSFAFLPLFLLAWFALRTLVQRLPSPGMGAAAALVLFVALWAPWPMRNHAALGAWIGTTTLAGRAWFMGAYGDGTLGAIGDFEAVEFGPGGADAAERSRREALLAPLKGLGEVEHDRAIQRIAFDLIAADPLGWLAKVALVPSRLWLRFPWEWPPSLRGLALTAVQLLWLVPAALGWWRVRRAGVPVVALEAGLAYLTAVHLFTTPVVRYAVPGMALACALVAAAFVREPR